MKARRSINNLPKKLYRAIFSGLRSTQCPKETSMTRTMILCERIFCGANQNSVSFFSDNLSYAEFKNANLEGVDFNAAILRNAKFTGSHLQNASLVGTDITGTFFAGADDGGVRFEPKPGGLPKLTAVTEPSPLRPGKIVRAVRVEKALGLCTPRRPIPRLRRNPNPDSVGLREIVSARGYGRLCRSNSPPAGGDGVFRRPCRWISRQRDSTCWTKSAPDGNRKIQKAPLAFVFAG